MGLKFIVLFLICGISAAMAIYFRKRFEETIAMSFMVISLALYFGGLLNFLEGFFLVIVGLLVILWIVSLIGMMKDFNTFKQYFITPGFIIFLCFFLMLMILQENLLLINWDEFSHWALTAKSTYYTNQLGSMKGSQVMFKDYPPGSVLFEYFWVKFTGFKESVLVTAYSTLLLSMLIIGTKTINWNKWQRTLVYIILILPIPLIFYTNAYASILIDPLLGVTFSYGLISLLIEERMSLFSSLRTAITLSFLLLIKSTAILGVIFVLIYAFLDLRLKDINSLHKHYHRKTYLVIVILPLMTQISWKIHLYLNHITATFPINALSGKAPHYYKSIIISFIEALFNKPLTEQFVDMSQWTYMALFIFLSVISLRFIHSAFEIKRYRLMISVLSVYGFFYFLSLLIMYLFIFDEYQGKVLAAYVRYSNVFNLSVFLVLVIVLFNYVYKDESKSIRSKQWIVGIMCLVMVLSPIGEAFNSFLPRELVANRKAVEENITLVKTYTQREDKICLILQNSSGYDYFMIKYLLFPRYADSVGSFSLGIPYNTDDYYTKALTVQEWKNGLLSQDFRYVYLYKSDEQFFKKYGSLFKDIEAVKGKKLFRVLEPSQPYLLEAVD